jgi:hypothetical protein
MVATRIADEVGQRAAFGHEAVDAEDQRHAGHRNGIGTTERVAASVMKPAPVMPAAPFELSMATSSSRIWSPSAQVDIGRLRDEQRRQRHVDIGAVEVEGIAGRNDEADDERLQPARSIFSIRLGSALPRNSCRDEQELFLDVADQRRIEKPL